MCWFYIVQSCDACRWRKYMISKRRMNTIMDMEESATLVKVYELRAAAALNSFTKYGLTRGDEWTVFFFFSSVLFRSRSQGTYVEVGKQTHASQYKETLPKTSKNRKILPKNAWQEKMCDILIIRFGRKMLRRPCSQPLFYYYDIMNSEWARPFAQIFLPLFVYLFIYSFRVVMVPPLPPPLLVSGRISV